MKEHQYFMKIALQEAQIAAEMGEVPVGAVLVKDGEIVAKAHNLVEKLQDVSAHAELLVMKKANSLLNQKYLSGFTLYVTLEPCIMCTGALIWAKIDKIVYGANDANVGACGSRFQLAQNEFSNHKIEIIHGILEAECELLIKDFFKKKRDS